MGALQTILNVLLCYTYTTSGPSYKLLVWKFESAQRQIERNRDRISCENCTESQKILYGKLKDTSRTQFACSRHIIRWRRIQTRMLPLEIKDIRGLTDHLTSAGFEPAKVCRREIWNEIGKLYPFHLGIRNIVSLRAQREWNIHHYGRIYCIEERKCNAFGLPFAL